MLVVVFLRETYASEIVRFLTAACVQFASTRRVVNIRVQVDCVT